MPEVPIVTDTPDFNGGLRFDENGLIRDAGEYILQPAERIDDKADMVRPSVLPMFNIFAANSRASDTEEMNARRLAEILLDVFQFDPTRVGFISIPDFAMSKPALEPVGLWRGENVVFRDLDTAKADGNGSGYFRVPQIEQLLATSGVYYALDSNAGPLVDGGETGWLEIGELSISADDSLAYGLGSNASPWL